MGADSAAVRGSALDGGTPALSLSVAGGQGRDDRTADIDGLGIISRGVVVLVVESDVLCGIGSRSRSLEGLLCGIAGGNQSVCVAAPVRGAIVLCDRLDEITVGSAHSDP